MSRYAATIRWERGADEDFAKGRFSRHHRWEFDGGLVVPASASPEIVPPPYSVAENVDPEEAFVASLSSCHMLWFLSIAAKRRLVVERYVDDAWGVMEENAEGRLAMTKVTLRPAVTFGGAEAPTGEAIDRMHHLAHESCFIANSVKTEIAVEPVRDAG